MWNRHCMKKKQAFEVHCNPKLSGFWTSNSSQTFNGKEKQKNLDQHEFCSTITRLQGNITQKNLLKKNIEWRKYKPLNFTNKLEEREHKFSKKFYWIWTMDAKVTTLWIGLETMWGHFWSPWTMSSKSWIVNMFQAHKNEFISVSLNSKQIGFGRTIALSLVHGLHHTSLYYNLQSFCNLKAKSYWKLELNCQWCSKYCNNLNLQPCISLQESAT